MKVVIPESQENCINVHELTKNHLIIGYLQGKPFCVIMEDSYGEFIAMSNASYNDGNISDSHLSILEVIAELLELYPNMTFEAYE